MTPRVPPAGLSPLRILQLLLLAGMFVAGALLYSRLPEQIPSHWGFSGEANGWEPKLIGAWMVPLIALVMSLALPFVRRLDPKQENYARFERAWLLIQVTMVAFLAYVYGLQLYASLHPASGLDVGRAILGGTGMIFASLGNLFGKLHRTYFVGIRTPWTLSNDEVWRRTHRLAGWLWVTGGLLCVVEAIVWIGPPAVILGGILGDHGSALDPHAA